MTGSFFDNCIYILEASASVLSPVRYVAAICIKKKKYSVVIRTKQKNLQTLEAAINQIKQLMRLLSSTNTTFSELLWVIRGSSGTPTLQHRTSLTTKTKFYSSAPQFYQPVASGFICFLWTLISLRHEAATGLQRKPLLHPPVPRSLRGSWKSRGTPRQGGSGVAKAQCWATATKWQNYWRALSRLAKNVT